MSQSMLTAEGERVRQRTEDALKLLASGVAALNHARESETYVIDYESYTQARGYVAAALELLR